MSLTFSSKVDKWLAYKYFYLWSLKKNDSLYIGVCRSCRSLVISRVYEVYACRSFVVVCRSSVVVRVYEV